MKALQENNIIATFPTSIGQKRCWFMEQMHPGNRGLNIAVRWELRGPVTFEMVAQAFSKIIARHEVLRTYFTEQDGEPVQNVVEYVDFKLGNIDLRNLGKSDRIARISEIAVEHAEQPFDMGVPCLLRVVMIHTDALRAELLISVHNAIFDGFSIGVLGHELGLTLEAMAKGTEPDIADLELQYGDYAQWSEDFARSGALDVEQDYWTETLRGMPYFELPSDRPRSPSEVQSASHSVDLPPDFEESMNAAARAQDTTVFSLGAAAFSVALSRFSGKQDISFAVQVAGRTDIDLEPLIGIFTNPIVLRFDVDDNTSLKTHAEAARNVVNGALAHQNLPFDKLVQVLNPQRDPLRIPLVSIMFNLQRAFLKEQMYGELNLVSVQSHSPATLYDLNISIVGRNAGWRMVIDYNANLFDADTMGNFSDILVEVFAQIAAQPNLLIEEISSISRDAPQIGVVEQPVPQVPDFPESSDDFDKLRAIWTGILDLPIDHADGDFFDLGGHSVLALRMLAQVGEEFEVRPSLYEFLSDPTLKGLSEYLRQADIPIVAPTTSKTPPQETVDGAIWKLIELHQGTADSPVLLTVNQPFMYRSLAQQMSSGCTVANIGLPGQDELAKLQKSNFEDAVLEAAQIVQKRYGDRPVVLCGLCVDGRVALGLAQALGELGKQVEVIAMIDTWAPGAIKAFSSLSRVWDSWRIRFRRLRYYFGLKMHGEITWRGFLSENSFAAGLLDRVGPRSDERDVETLVDATVSCLVDQTRNYDFKPYDGEVVLFVTRSQGMVPKDGVLGWSDKLARDVAVYPVNGWHGDALIRSGFDRVTAVLDDKMKRLTSREHP